MRLTMLTLNHMIADHRKYISDIYKHRKKTPATPI